jgi:glutathione S-transferase
MPLPILYGHPFSSYTQKALIGLWENDVAIDYRVLGPDHPEHGAQLAALWPVGKFPVLDDGGHVVVEATSILDHAQVRWPGAVPLVPADPAAAVAVRMLDRVFDNHVMAPMQAIVAAHIARPGAPDAEIVARNEAALDKAYGWIEARLPADGWIAGAFGLADCAAAPSLFYADWVRPIPASCPRLRTYRARLLARPSVARAVDEGRPYRGYFPPGAPDRD